MPEMFNRILRAFGANRVQIERWQENHIVNLIEFRIVNFGDFVLVEHDSSYRVEEWRKDLSGWDGRTSNSRWLTAIAGGMKRDDEGRPA